MFHRYVYTLLHLQVIIHFLYGPLHLFPFSFQLFFHLLIIFFQICTPHWMRVQMIVSGIHSKNEPYRPSDRVTDLYHNNNVIVITADWCFSFRWVFILPCGWVAIFRFEVPCTAKVLRWAIALFWSFWLTLVHLCVIFVWLSLNSVAGAGLVQRVLGPTPSKYIK